MSISKQDSMVNEEREKKTHDDRVKEPEESPVEYGDEEEMEEENEEGLETSGIQKFLSPLYLIILVVFLVTACIPLWILLVMFLYGTSPELRP